MKHTPGPAVRVQFFDADGHVIAEATGKPCATYRAAPDLLALVRAWLITDPHGTHSDACSAAIAKAEQS